MIVRSAATNTKWVDICIFLDPLSISDLPTSLNATELNASKIIFPLIFNFRYFTILTK